MKKVKFSFECSQDPLAMPMDGKDQRYCNECHRSIHDFTKLSPAQIIQLKNSDPNLCGFMMPWQLDELNLFIANKKEKTALWGRLVKAAAIAGAPFMATPGFGQKNKPTTQIEYHMGLETNPCTELLLRDREGKPITHLVFQVMNGNEVLEKIQPDSTGKLSFSHLKYKNYTTLRIWQPEYKIEQFISVKREAICTIWEINMNQLMEERQKVNYDFKFVYKDEKDKPIKLTEVEIELFDSSNTIIKTYVVNTNIGGYANLNVHLPQNTYRLYFTLKTKDGNKRAYLKVEELTSQTENVVKVSKHFRHKMGRMINPRF